MNISRNVQNFHRTLCTDQLVLSAPVVPHHHQRMYYEIICHANDKYN